MQEDDDCRTSGTTLGPDGGHGVGEKVCLSVDEGERGMGLVSTLVCYALVDAVRGLFWLLLMLSLLYIQEDEQAV